MGRDSSLSSDIDLIREFEELKLKQQLLIKALQSKEKVDKEKVLTNIESKLDFIVQIFQKTAEVEESSNIEETLNHMLQKFDDFEKKIDEKFSSVEEKISKIENTNSLNSNSNSKTISKEINPKDEGNKSNDEPPKPDFGPGVDIKENIDSKQNQPNKELEANTSQIDTEKKDTSQVEIKEEIPKKKKRWF